MGCKLNPEPVKIRKTCDHPGYYKQVCHLEYEPCEGKVEEATAMPIYKGCFDANGNKIDGNGSSVMRSSDQAAFTQDVDIQVTVPSSYTQTGRQTVRDNTVRNNGRGLFNRNRAARVVAE